MHRSRKPAAQKMSTLVSGVPTFGQSKETKYGNKKTTYCGVGQSLTRHVHLSASLASERTTTWRVQVTDIYIYIYLTTGQRRQHMARCERLNHSTVSDRRHQQQLALCTTASWHERGKNAPLNSNVSENFLPKIQNLGPETSNLGKLKSKTEIFNTHNLLLVCCVPLIPLS